jgi:hypothetical protein
MGHTKNILFLNISIRLGGYHGGLDFQKHGIDRYRDRDLN